jgi:hypothetical protein
VRLAADAHPRLADRPPVKFQIDAVAVGERDAVVMEGIEHLDSLATRKREVAQVRLLGNRCVRIVEVVRRLQVEPRRVVEHKEAATCDADVRT